jgi:hypothetical protein
VNQQDIHNIIGNIDPEALYARELREKAMAGYERATDPDTEREYLQTAALALNALGNLRLAQAIYQQQLNHP